MSGVLQSLDDDWRNDVWMNYSASQSESALRGDPTEQHLDI
jgi:hypothetical protein